ncbi:formyltetrahydrofolate deformylase [Dehalogenimonas alkenigignens]|uniref:Formyltetrahydrofolate deformylase n=1 Tax=Dehalogenimonas alkenigignens TaxID=1217799 RepID=A0A0W0GHI0_9CHLR|nr:formyltetrahydrofolate deformylase [Dehalogenimonas alkenigignens]KTB48019.1 formyltetrahydrofolate deformylase [Dehalogenimonas alkenigignens]PVV84278.1 formyltetrahydrofolate deformylase [Dehalogenimonas alkenigignens]
MTSAILKVSCQDRRGIIAAVSGFISDRGGNIITLDEFVERNSNTFFMRVEWDIHNFSIEREHIAAAVDGLAAEGGFGGKWEIFFSDIKPQMAVFVSKYDHCLWDLLLRHQAGELRCDIPVIISNHEDLRPAAEFFGIPYRVVPKTAGNKSQAERREFEILESYRIDFVVMARYMQVLSEDFLSRYQNRVINIHHSFLPAFEGARPYHQAFERGVKIIGATAHFATVNLDKGPIIHQATLPISHQDTVDDLITKGRDIEKRVLSDGVKLYIAHRVFVHGNRTIIL